MFKQETKFLQISLRQRAIEVSGKVVRQDNGKLSQEMEELIKKRRSIQASNPKSRIELAEISKPFNKRKAAGIQKNFIGKIE